MTKESSPLSKITFTLSITDYNVIQECLERSKLWIMDRGPHAYLETSKKLTDQYLTHLTGVK